jgi:hypothetical protein
MCGGISSRVSGHLENRVGANNSWKSGLNSRLMKIIAF